jgi:hypothetical protein
MRTESERIRDAELDAYIACSGNSMQQLNHAFRKFTRIARKVYDFLSTPAAAKKKGETWRGYTRQKIKVNKINMLKIKSLTYYKRERKVKTVRRLMKNNRGRK